MKTDIEKEFFKVFGIEPKQQDACTVEDKYWQNEELANKYDTFEDALSGYINQIWQSLTDQEKEEIRGILNER